MIHVISVSGGKDSTATLLLALERVPRDRIYPIFCDTGNEHAAVYAYLDYLERALGVSIVRLRADFSKEIAAKRQFIARDRRTRREYDTAPKLDAHGQPVTYLDEDGEECQRMKKVGGGRLVRWTNRAKRRALAVLYPTGNPYLDLCLWKGRFPSRKAQFCTTELKTNLAVEYQLAFIDQGHTVVSWQGVRRDESQNRRDAKQFERIAPGLFHYRPIVDWNAERVFEYCARRGVEPNPLYLQGMGRVGCMPCINAKKMELREIAQRFPEHVARISEWERLVCQAGKRNFATFFASTNSPVEMKGLQDREIFAQGNIHQIVEWAHTTRGGKQYDLLGATPSPTCSSAYGLCE